MKTAAISITEQGRMLSEKIAELCAGTHEINRFCFWKHTDGAAVSFTSISELTAQIFSEYEALIFVCACGIAVRAAAGNLISKAADPAVLVIDDCGKFVISLLSGHFGGANALTEQIAQKLHAVPVITTATDAGKKFSPDSFAKANDLILTDLHAAKEIASAVLDNEKIGLVSEYAYQNCPALLTEHLSCRTGICISADSSENPFPVTLHLMPKNIVLGIGCKKNTSPERLEHQIISFLEKSGILISRVSAIASIDLKKHEPALVQFCEAYQLNFLTYTAEELMAVTGTFSSSDFVRQITGADNICERSAVKCSQGRLIIPKYAADGVTIAAAEREILLDFERGIRL